MARHEMRSTDVRRDFRDALNHILRGDEVIVTHYDRPIAILSPYTEEQTMTYLPVDEDSYIDGQGRQVPKKQRYTTRQDAIEQDILPALTEGEYDVEAICREAYEYRIDTNERGQELLNTAGFEQVVSDEEFWEIVARHDTSGEQ